MQTASGPFRPRLTLPLPAATLAGAKSKPGLESPRVPAAFARRYGASRTYASWLPIGSRRMRLPVAAKMALHSAGANGGMPGSPTPLAGTSMPCSTM